MIINIPDTINKSPLSNQVEVNTLLYFIKETLKNHTIFSKTQVRDLQEDLILNEAQISIVELAKIASVLEKDSYLPIELMENFLIQRWQRIKGSVLSYTGMPEGYINYCCLKIAEILHQIRPEKKKMQYLMPTITHLIDAIGLFPDKPDIDDYSLDEVILSEDYESLIPVNILSSLSSTLTVSDLANPFVKQQSDTVSLLSQDEQKRLIAHNEDGQRLSKLYQEILSIKTQNQSFGGKLLQLIEALRQGGQHGKRGGSEFNAGQDANIGITDFMNYWLSIKEDEKNKVSELRTNCKTIGEVINILSGVDKVSMSCVEVNANILDNILKAHPELYNISTNSKEYLLVLEKEFNYFKQKLETSTRGIDQLKLVTPNLLENSNLFEKENIIKLGRSLAERYNLHQAFLTVIKAYLKTSHCSPQALRAVTNHYNYTTALTGFLLTEDLIKLIIASEHCTFEVLAQPNYKGDNALAYAIVKTNINIMQAILTSPYCSPQLLMEKNKVGHSPYILAIKSGQLDVVTAIINSLHYTYEVLNQQNSNDENPFMIAVEVGNEEIVKAIMAGPHFSLDFLMKKNKAGHTALMLAVEKNRLPVVTTILTSAYCNFDVLSQRDSEGMSALMRAGQHGSADLLKEIMANPHCNHKLLLEKNKFNCTPLMLAVTNSHINAVRTLTQSLHCNFDVLCQSNSHGDTALIIAAEKNNVDVANAIMANTNFNQQVLMQQNRYGKSALIVAACKIENSATVRAILNNPFCTSEVLMQCDQGGHNALIKAVKHQCLETIGLILTSPYFNQKILMQQTPYGYTALMEAVNQRDVNIVKLLLESPICNQAVLMQQDKDGNSALLQAVKQGEILIIQAILSSPWCNIEVLSQKDNQGKTAFACSEDEPIQLLINEKIRLLGNKEEEKEEKPSISSSSFSFFTGPLTQNPSKDMTYSKPLPR